MFYQAQTGWSLGRQLPVLAAVLLSRPDLRRRQRKREVLARVVASAYRHDDVLAAVDTVSHRRTALLSRHQNCADFLTCLLVVRTEHCAAGASRRSRNLRVARNDERLGDQDTDALALSGLLRNSHSQTRQCCADWVRCIAMRHLEQKRALVDVDGAEYAIRRFQERQTFQVGYQAATTATTAAATGSRGSSATGFSGAAASASGSAT